VNRTLVAVGFVLSVLAFLTFQNCGLSTLSKQVKARRLDSGKVCKVTVNSKQTLAKVSGFRQFTEKTGRKVILHQSLDYLVPKGTRFTVKLREDIDCGKPLYRRVRLKRDMTVADIDNYFSRQECVEGASLSHKVYPLGVPNDPLYSDQAWLVNIQAAEAWDTFFNPTTGIKNETLIGIIDEGIENHQDLRLWTNPREIPGNGIDDDGNGFVDDIHGWNFVDNNNDTSPASSTDVHGTHVSGLASAIVNNGVGVAGVAGGVSRVISGKVFDGPYGAYDSNIANAVRYAVDMGAKVINMSLGGRFYPTPAPVKDEIARAIQLGVTVVVGAGNGRCDVSNCGNPPDYFQLNGFELSHDYSSQNYFTPAAYSADFPGEMLTVASTDSTTKELSKFSNFSTTYVQIAAPGADNNWDSTGLLSTEPPQTYAKYYFGTSWSTAVVSGAAALVYGLAESRGYTVTPKDVVGLIVDSGEPRNSLQGKIQSGKMLNLKRLADLMDAQYPASGIRPQASPPPIPVCP